MCGGRGSRIGKLTLFKEVDGRRSCLQSLLQVIRRSRAVQWVFERAMKVDRMVRAQANTTQDVEEGNRCWVSRSIECWSDGLTNSPTLHGHSVNGKLWLLVFELTLCAARRIPFAERKHEKEPRY